MNKKAILIALFLILALITVSSAQEIEDAKSQMNTIDVLMPDKTIKTAEVEVRTDSIVGEEKVLDVMKGDTYKIIYDKTTTTTTKIRDVIKTIQEPVYATEKVEVLCNTKNETCYKCKSVNETFKDKDCKDKEIQVIVGYTPKEIVVQETYDTPLLKADDCERKGIVINGVEKNDAQYNTYNGKIYRWKYPQKCRNWAEFPACRDFEIQKGVCEEVKV